MRLTGLAAGAAVVTGLGVRWGLVFADDATPEAGETEHTHRTYEGDEGPEHWGDLDPTYKSCSGETAQAPIDITGETGADIPNIEFSYQPISPLHIKNNGHEIEIKADTGGRIVLDGITYDLKQFHFHLPSDHSVDGQSQTMEMHLVHPSAEKAWPWSG